MHLLRTNLPTPTQREHLPLTIATVYILQGWLRKRLGIESVFVLERGAERNRALLRLSGESGTGEVEVRWLDDLRRLRLSVDGTRDEIRGHLAQN